MKEEELSKDEIRELEEMAQIGKETFPGNLTNVEDTLANRIDEIIPPIKKTTSSHQPRSWWIAIIIISVIALSTLCLLISKDKASPPVEYAMAYYKTPPFVLSQSNRGTDEISNELSDINNAYKRKDYKKVVTLTEHQDFEGLKFYRGIALYELGRTKEAISSLDQSSDDELMDMRTWYLALAYLRAENLQSAQSELEKIVNIRDHYKNNQATELLEKIKSSMN